jgi:hypothetical protein
MAIKKIIPVEVEPNTEGDETNQEEKILIEINNGHLKALKRIAEKWDFKDIISVLQYGIAVLDQADPLPRYVTIKQLAESTNLTPTKTLLKEVPQKTEEVGESNIGTD